MFMGQIKPLFGAFPASFVAGPLRSGARSGDPPPSSKRSLGRPSSGFRWLRLVLRPPTADFGWLAGPSWRLAPPAWRCAPLGLLRTHSSSLVSLPLNKYGKVKVVFFSDQGATKEHSLSYATEKQRRYEQKDQDLVYNEFSGNDTRPMDHFRRLSKMLSALY